MIQILLCCEFLVNPACQSLEQLLFPVKVIKVSRQTLVQKDWVFNVHITSPSGIWPVKFTAVTSSLLERNDKRRLSQASLPSVRLSVTDCFILCFPPSSTGPGRCECCEIPWSHILNHEPAPHCNRVMRHSAAIPVLSEPLLQWSCEDIQEGKAVSEDNTSTPVLPAPVPWPRQPPRQAV